MTVERDFGAALRDPRRRVVLDGGLGSELAARGHDVGDVLWSARVLRDDPEAVGAVHEDYLRAGADCITSASYQVTFDALPAVDAERLLRLSVEVAVAARGSRDAWVAASVGPYAAALADGSEYTGVYDRGERALVAWHERRLAVLEATAADVLACETIPAADEVRALAALLDRGPGPPAWLSLCCRDARSLSDGTPLAECAAHLAGHPRIVAIGINCTAPQHVAGAIEELRAAGDKPVLVYPNAGGSWDARAKAWQGRSEVADFTAGAVGWRRAGAAAIGGCCRIGPRHIAALAAGVG